MREKLKLNSLLEGIINEELLSNIEIQGISVDSTRVNQNDLFVAISGYQQDGHDFIDDAIKAGATAIVGEKEISELTVPYIKVANSRLALAKIASNFYNHPSKKQKIIGITGTNGKTTTSFMLKHILEEAGLSCSLFGSVFNVVNGQVSSSKHTTLNSLELQRQLYISEDDVIIMEVSSHGLSQFRVEGIEFDYCLFTNLDEEHLDYHEDMEEYFSIKASLFNKLKLNGNAIVNGYNSWGEKLIDKLKGNASNIVTMGEGMNHDLQIVIKKSEERSSTLLKQINKSYELKLKMLGHHNVYNAAMAFLTAKELGIAENRIIRSLETLKGVPGRFETIQHPEEATFVIDYAHTADAFYHCLKTARDSGAKRIYHVFGFRGNRDENKRQAMINISNELSDLSILTFDDLNDVPAEEMETNLRRLNVQEQGIVIPDRTLAIKFAWTYASKGDWVIITGKGVETYQQLYKIPTSSDKETIEYLLQ